MKKRIETAILNKLYSLNKNQVRELRHFLIFIGWMCLIASIILSAYTFVYAYGNRSPWALPNVLISFIIQFILIWIKDLFSVKK